MLSQFEPREYLSKRENGTYSIICNGTSINNYTSKQECLKLAERFNISLSEEIWSAKDGSFIFEN